MMHFKSQCCNSRVFPVEFEEDVRRLNREYPEEMKAAGPGLKFICVRCGKLQTKVNIQMKGGRRR